MQWKSIVEIPFLSLFEVPILSSTLPENSGRIKGSGSDRVSVFPTAVTKISIQAEKKSQKKKSEEKRSTTFYFSGRLFLWLPERVCSVRNSVASELSVRSDSVLFNLNENETYSAVKESMLDYLLNSVFCIIAKSNSYSSAFFYDALHAGCVPIVIRYVLISLNKYKWIMSLCHNRYHYHHYFYYHHHHLLTILSYCYYHCYYHYHYCHHPSVRQ